MIFDCPQKGGRALQRSTPPGPTCLFPNTVSKKNLRPRHPNTQLQVSLLPSTSSKVKTGSDKKARGRTLGLESCDWLPPG